MYVEKIVAKIQIQILNKVGIRILGLIERGPSYYDLR